MGRLKRFSDEFQTQIVLKKFAQVEKSVEAIHSHTKAFVLQIKMRLLFIKVLNAKGVTSFNVPDLTKRVFNRFYSIINHCIYIFHLNMYASCVEFLEALKHESFTLILIGFHRCCELYWSF